MWPQLPVWPSAFEESPSLFDTGTLNKLFLRENRQKNEKCMKADSQVDVLAPFPMKYYHIKKPLLKN